MGKSHYKSNLKAFAGTETIRKFASIASLNSIEATTFVGLTSLAAPTITGETTRGTTKVTSPIVSATAITGGTVRGTNYIEVGTDKFIFHTDFSDATSIVKEATAISASIKGSIALGDGELWIFTGDTAATMFTIP